jgi:hypothetical protein
VTGRLGHFLVRQLVPLQVVLALKQLSTFWLRALPLSHRQTIGGQVMLHLDEGVGNHATLIRTHKVQLFVVEGDGRAVVDRI